MLDRSRRRFEEGTRLVEEAHRLLGDIQQALIGSPRSASPEDSEEAASRLLASIKASGGEMPETLCGGRPGGRPGAAADPHRRPSDRHHRDGISRARAARLRPQQCRHPGDAAEASLPPRRRPAAAQDHRRVHLQAAQEAAQCVSGGAEFIETIPQRGWILRDIERPQRTPDRVSPAADSHFDNRARLPRSNAAFNSRVPRRHPEPGPYAEAVARLASIRHALRLVDPHRRRPRFRRAATSADGAGTKPMRPSGARSMPARRRWSAPQPRAWKRWSPSISMARHPMPRRAARWSIRSAASWPRFPA